MRNRETRCRGFQICFSILLESNIKRVTIHPANGFPKWMMGFQSGSWESVSPTRAGIFQVLVELGFSQMYWPHGLCRISINSYRIPVILELRIWHVQLYKMLSFETGHSDLYYADINLKSTSKYIKGKNTISTFTFFNSNTRRYKRYVV